MREIINQLKEYLSCNKAERRGIFSLLLIINLLLLFNFALPWIIDPYVWKLDEDSRVKLNKLIESYADSSEEQFTGSSEASLVRELSPFNPNEVRSDDLREMGVDEKLIRTWMNYRSKGGRFRSVTGFRKLYGLSQEEYNRLSPFLVFPQNEKRGEDINNGNGNAPGVIDLNKVDSATLVKVRGIGPVFANRILKYRSSLGGFTSPEQLREIFGIDSAKYAGLGKVFMAEASGITKMSLANAEFKTLSRHPYIGYEKTKKIFSLRRSGTYLPPDSTLLLLGVFSSSEFLKVKAYLEE